MSDREPYLSVVVATRNDDHGGNPLWRLQAFVDTFDAQCRLTGLDAEVIIVEWNPPVGRPRLIDVLPLPQHPACAYRFIEVPPDLHAMLSHAEALPLFQMIAKNVGIRRARGAFVLATNIDIILSNELVHFIAGRNLEPGGLYRVDRHDVESQLPLDQPVEGRLEYCRSHQLRVHRRSGTYPVHSDGQMLSEPDDIVNGRDVLLQDGWHFLESNVLGTFRWAAPCARVLLDPRGVTPTANILEIDLQPNHYHPSGRFDLEIADEMGRVLTRFEVVSRMVYRLPLSTVPRELSLRYIATERNAESFMPWGEWRRTLAYVVRSIRLRHLDERFSKPREYPLSGWRPEGSAVIQIASDGRSLNVALPHASDVVKFGPLRATAMGPLRLVLEWVSQPGIVEFAAVQGDGKRLPLSIEADVVMSDRRATTATVSLDFECPFWLTLTVHQVPESGTTQFTIRRLTGAAVEGVEVPELLREPAVVRSESDRLGGREFPLDQWRPATVGAVVQMRDDGGGIEITAPRGGYVAKYGPLTAVFSGEYRFALHCTGDNRTLALGALSGSDQLSLPGTASEMIAGDRRILTLTVTAEARQPFWLMVSAPLSLNNRSIRFGIRGLSGSTSAGSAAELIAPNSYFELTPSTLERPPGRFGAFVTALVHRIGSRSGSGIRHVVEEARHAVAVSSLEMRSLANRYGALEAKYLELSTTVAAGPQPPDLFLNASGDFQLMARQDWINLRGYPEIQAFSMSIDGMLGTIAFFAGIQERVLDSPCQIYHLEHERGSGWTPEGEDKLRQRVNERGIPWVDARIVSELAAYMAFLDRPMILNDSGWGFGLHELPEQALQAASDQSSEAR